MEEQPSGTSGPPAPVDEVDRQLWDQLAEIVATFGRHPGEVWRDDFRPDRMPLVFVRSRRGVPVHGYALNLSSPTALAADAADVLRPVHDHLLGQLARRTVWFNESVAAALCPRGDDVRYAVNVGGQECLVLHYGVDARQLLDWDHGRFIVHECFHQYQLFESFWKLPPGYDPAVPYHLPEQSVGAAVKETRLLDLAVESTNPRTTLDLLGRFMAVRAGRHRRWPEIAVLERGHEQVEGTARYVENAYARVNGRRSRLEVPTEASVPEPDWLSAGRFYRTGARMLELLDWFELDWRTRVTEGDDPYGILSDHLLQPGGPRLPARPLQDRRRLPPA